jgi:quercetin dioxygenase-like cupin family protein
VKAQSGAYLHQPGSAELRWLGETSTYFLADGDDTRDAFALVDERARRGESVPLHLHKDDMESFYVLEGELTFFLDQEAGVRATAGAFVHVPGGTVHGFRVESETARYLILTTPQHGRFYREITLPSRPGGLPPLESVEGETIRRAARDFGIEFVGPLPDVPSS